MNNDDNAEAILRRRFGEVHRVYDFGDDGQAWLADPGASGARSLRDVLTALRQTLYVAELAWAGGKWCVEVHAFDPKTGRPLRDRHAGVTPMPSKARARSTLRAWALLLAGRFDTDAPGTA
ncbi:MAG TPA: hypothetical protein VF292_01500 [Rhodanobacteraceae bacterium]